MVAATLVGSSLLLQGLGKLTKDSLDSSEGLSGKILAILNKKMVINLILFESPTALTDFSPDRKPHFLHGMILRLKNVFLAALAR